MRYYYCIESIDVFRGEKANKIKLAQKLGNSNISSQFEIDKSCFADFEPVRSRLFREKLQKLMRVKYTIAEK